MNFVPEFDDKFIILFVNVSKEAFNNGIGDRIRSFDLKTKYLGKELEIFRDLLVMPEFKVTYFDEYFFLILKILHFNCKIDLKP